MYRRGLRVGSARFVGPTSWGAGVDPTEEDSGEDLAEEAILAPEFCDGSGEDEDGEGAGPMEAAESASSGGEEPDASRGPAVPGVAAAEVQRFALAARSWAEGLQSLGAALLVGRQHAARLDKHVGLVRLMQRVGGGVGRQKPSQPACA